MRRNPLLGVGLVLIAAWLVFAPAAVAQDGGQVQFLHGAIGERTAVIYVMPNLRAGDVLTLRVGATTGDLDPFVGVIAGSANVDELRNNYWAEIELAIASGEDPILAMKATAERYLLAWDDDSGEGYDALLDFVIPADGVYRILVTSSLAKDSAGRFELQVGLNAPQLRAGSAAPTGPVFVQLDLQATPPRQRAAVVEGEISPAAPTRRFTLMAVEPGDTVYARVEALGGVLQPTLQLLDFGEKPLRSANLGGAASQGVLEYTFPADTGGEGYALLVGSAGEGAARSGRFRLTIGINTPEVLGGEVQATEVSPLAAPIPVQVGVRLQQIVGVDQRQQMFEAVVSITLEWTDPALAFNPASCNCRFKSYSGENFARFIGDNGLRWPEFNFYNQQNNRWVQNKMAIVYPDGRAMYLERFTTSFQAPDFDFRKYPFDQQDFFIRVDSIFPENFYVFEDMPAFTEIGNELGEEEWVIVDSGINISTETASTLFPSSRYSFHFAARRHLDYYIIRLFLPLLLIIIVSYLTFYLKDFSKRVDVATGNLLLFIAFNFTVASDLPRLGYLTFLDALMVSIFIISVALVAYNVLMKRLQIQGKEALVNRVDRHFDWLYPLIFIVAIGIVILIFLV